MAQKEHESIILKSMTIREEGYSPDSLGRTSTKHIWATCRLCGEPSRLTKGNFNKKGSACHNACRLAHMRRQKSPFSDPKIREKAKRTNLERYGVEHASQNSEIAQKISNKLNNDEVKEKIKNTNLERYGVENPSQSIEIKNKIIESNRERFGCDFPLQSDDVKEKQKTTLLDRYGEDNPMKIEEFRERAKRTNRDRYGVDNVMQNKELSTKSRDKRNESIAKDEGNNYLLINTLRGDAFWDRIKEQAVPLTAVCEEFGLNYGSVTSALCRLEFQEKYYKFYHFPKQQEQFRIKDIIESWGINVECNNREVISPLEIDIYIPELKFGIEYNGSVWHSEMRLDRDSARTKHANKTKKAIENGVRIVHIFEHTWKEREKQYLNFLRSSIGLNEKKIMARKCEITNDSCREFFEDNHIQGYGRRTIKYFNLLFNEEIVASMTASTHHRNSNKDSIILNRLCFSDNATVIGGASKLFKSFCKWAKKEGYKNIISWSDNCWTQGEIYKKLGFTLDSTNRPDYFYYDSVKRRYRSKQSQRKSATGCPFDIKERDWCLERGLFRIWGAGKHRWTYNISRYA